MSAIRSWRWILGVGALLATAGCAITNAQLDDLRKQVAEKRALLTATVDSQTFRMANADLSVEVEGKPLNDLLSDFNAKPQSDRQTLVVATGSTGHLYYHLWFDCFWGGHASWFVDLVPASSFAGGLQLGTFGYNWSGPDGFNFDISARALAGGTAVGYIDNCLWQTPILPIVFVGYADEHFYGRLEPSVIGDSAQFEFHVTSPNHITVWSFLDGVWFWLNEDSMDNLGTLSIDSIIGKKGRVKDALANICRDYTLDVNVKNPRVLAVGLSLDADVSVTWDDQKPCDQ